MMWMLPPLSSASSIGFAAPASNALGLLLVAGEEVAEIESADQRHQVRRDRRARNHQVDHPELHRVDDVDLLAELIVGKEGDLDLLAEPVRLQALDEVVVVDAAVGIFGIVRKRRRASHLQGRGLRAADDRGRGSEPRRSSSRRPQHDAAVHMLRRHDGAPPQERIVFVFALSWRSRGRPPPGASLATLLS
ncbi:hypothetical protein ACVWW1_003657 [Bradyrhizobium sp. JR3.5]